MSQDRPIWFKEGQLAEAYDFVHQHQVFIDEFGISQFELCFEVRVVKVNPVTNEVDSDREKNTKTVIWIECGRWFTADQLREEDPDYEGTTGSVHYDENLMTAGDTFEEAFLKLANNLKNVYGD